MNPATVLTRSALVLAVVVALLLYPLGSGDQGAFFLALGVPVLVTLVPVLASGRPVERRVTVAAAVLLLTWALVSAAGIGLFLVPVALLEGAAAMFGGGRRIAA